MGLWNRFFVVRGDAAVDNGSFLMQESWSVTFISKSAQLVPVLLCLKTSFKRPTAAADLNGFFFGGRMAGRALGNKGEGVRLIRLSHCRHSDRSLFLFHLQLFSFLYFSIFFPTFFKLFFFPPPALSAGLRISLCPASFVSGHKSD